MFSAIHFFLKLPRLKTVTGLAREDLLSDMLQCYPAGNLFCFRSEFQRMVSTRWYISRTTFIFISGDLVVWFWVLFIIENAPTPGSSSGNAPGNIFSHGYTELAKVWKQIQKMPVIKRYLGAFFFYNMGVQTVMLAATLYGTSELQIEKTSLIISILLIQLVAIPGAFAISKLSSTHWKFSGADVGCVFLGFDLYLGVFSSS
jgi:MFS-type transporter involved in bile tolerance (Atg22 family)